VAARQRKLDAARAAAAAAAADDSSDAADAATAAADEATAAEPDDDGSAMSSEAYYASAGGIDDELMGSGFSAFLHSMHPDDAPTVLYGDDDGSDEWEGQEDEAGNASSQQQQ
jgi:hypothetical protein